MWISALTIVMLAVMQDLSVQVHQRLRLLVVTGWAKIGRSAACPWMSFHPRTCMRLHEPIWLCMSWEIARMELLLCISQM